MRVFNSFPKGTNCPVCGTDMDSQCMLVPIDDSKENDGHNVEAIPTHLTCILSNIRYSRHHKLMGLEAKEE